jgi:hypothetical protein
MRGVWCIVDCGLMIFHIHTHVLDPKSESKVRVSLRDRLSCRTEDKLGGDPAPAKLIVE